VSLIIDGYNLLNATGIAPRGDGPGNLERSRVALLNFLTQAIEPSERLRTTVVFDAGDDAPRGLPRTLDFNEMTVRFAAEYENADALIEELIRADTAPRSLTVVSSDHQLQRAAKRRRAKAVDSDRWFAELVRRRNKARRSDKQHQSAKPQTPPTESEVEYWLDEFSGNDPPANEQSLGSPFPPGYAEDAARDLEEDLK
jgi:predicted RNA-binding protein with PIN domain